MTGVVALQSLDGGIDTGSNTTARSKQFTSNITAGSTLLATVASFNTNPTNLTVSDDKGNTWILIDAIYDGNSRGISAYYCVANAGSVGAMPTVTVAKNGQACGVSLMIFERGTDTTTRLDVVGSHATGVSSGPAQVALAGPTVYTNDEVWGVIGVEQAAYVTCTPLSGYTDIVANTNTALALQQKVQTRATTTTGTFTPGWTLSAGSHWNVVAFALRGTTTAPTVSGTDTATPRQAGSLTITGINFGASQGTGSVSLGGVAQTVTAWSDTSITVTVARGTNKYGAALNLIVTTGTGAVSNTSAAITGLLPQTGWSYVNVGTPNTTAAFRVTATADIASGDQLAWDTKSGAVVVLADGTFSDDGTVASFAAEAWFTGNGWGASGLQTLGSGGGSGGIIASFNGVLLASIASINGVAIGSIASINGIPRAVGPPVAFSTYITGGKVYRNDTNTELFAAGINGGGNWGSFETSHDAADFGPAGYKANVSRHVLRWFGLYGGSTTDSWVNDATKGYLDPTNLKIYLNELRALYNAGVMYIVTFDSNAGQSSLQQSSTTPGDPGYHDGYNYAMDGTKFPFDPAYPASGFSYDTGGRNFGTDPSMRAKARVAWKFLVQAIKDAGLLTGVYAWEPAPEMFDGFADDFLAAHPLTTFYAERTADTYSIDTQGLRPIIVGGRGYESGNIADTWDPTQRTWMYTCDLFMAGADGAAAPNITGWNTHANQLKNFPATHAYDNGQPCAIFCQQVNVKTGRDTVARDGLNTIVTYLNTNRIPATHWQLRQNTDDSQGTGLTDYALVIKHHADNSDIYKTAEIGIWQPYWASGTQSPNFKAGLPATLALVP